eukprot:COSAG01_NODE_54982_length_328_cov_0.908297_1_plen_47_part_01
MGAWLRRAGLYDAELSLSIPSQPSQKNAPVIGCAGRTSCLKYEWRFY